MDFSNLRGRIRARFSTQAAFAHAIGMSACALSKKLNGHTEWTAGEMRKACEVLQITIAEIPIYFFCFNS